jgi:hypothetical protein
VNDAQEAHGAAAVVVADGCIAGGELCDALGGDCSLLAAQGCEAVVRSVEIVLPVPVLGRD